MKALTSYEEKVGGRVNNFIDQTSEMNPWTSNADDSQKKLGGD